MIVSMNDLSTSLFYFGNVYTLSKELCLHLLKFICRQKLPRRKRLCLWSHCSLLCQTVKLALHEMVKRILFWSHCPLLYQTVKFFFSRNGKANIVMITLPITVSDCHFFPRTGKANIVILTSLITVSDCQVLITCFI